MLAKMQSHIAELGFASAAAYQEWCRCYHLSPSLNKNARQRRKEQRLILTTSDSDYRYRLRLYRREQKRKAGMDSLKESKPKDILLASIDQHSTLRGRSNLFRSSDYTDRIGKLASYHKDWVRSPEKGWCPKTGDKERQFLSLVRHLFARYPVPKFMYKVWLTENVDGDINAQLGQSWFIHVGSGKNIRTAPNLPVALTKKEAHHFLRAPSNYTIKEAFRWGQVRALGGNRPLADAIIGTRISAKWDPFWLSVIRFFIDHPELDLAHVGPIVDYLYHQKFKKQTLTVERGVIEEITPPQPHLSMKGRSPEKLLAEVNRWHKALARESGAAGLAWPASDIKGGAFVGKNSDGEVTGRWLFTELLSGSELIAEGRAMRHCVADYAEDCYEGSRAIFGLKTENSLGELDRLLTIEVRLEDKKIVQVSGKANRAATDRALKVIRAWAADENLQMASYL